MFCRTVEIVCSFSVDKYRVPLAEGGYINATFVPGSRSLTDWVVAQHPTPESVGHLWSMVQEHAIQILVLVSLIDDKVLSLPLLFFYVVL